MRPPKAITARAGRDRQHQAPAKAGRRVPSLDHDQEPASISMAFGNPASAGLQCAALSGA
jgi:hypothetical protein